MKTDERTVANIILMLKSGVEGLALKLGFASFLVQCLGFVFGTCAGPCPTMVLVLGAPFGAVTASGRLGVCRI